MRGFAATAPACSVKPRLEGESYEVELQPNDRCGADARESPQNVPGTAVEGNAMENKSGALTSPEASKSDQAPSTANEESGDAAANICFHIFWREGVHQPRTVNKRTRLWGSRHPIKTTHIKINVFRFSYVSSHGYDLVAALSKKKSEIGPEEPTSPR